jgi:hypothetical protein
LSGILPPARFGAAVLAASSLLIAHPTGAHPTAAHRVPLTRVSTDPFTNSGSQHATEVEPDIFASGRTIVGAYQAGRFVTGGSSDIGWATSANGGRTWQHGMLPGLTIHQGGGKWQRASDPAIVYDAKHRTWMIADLGVSNGGAGLGAAVSRSADGVHWRKPVIAFGNDKKDYDKDWITCDDHAASPHYGNCYIEADVVSAGLIVIMSTSHDGGATWSTPRSPSGQPRGLGGQPLVQPDGTVIVPFEGNGVEAFFSRNGGASWTGVRKIANVTIHPVAGNMRDGEGLPSASVDAAGKIYVAWQDCRFRARCSANDIVFATSADGTGWSRVTRIPIDATTSGVDHFIAGIGVDPTSSGTRAKIGLYYYFFPKAGCSVATCELRVGYVSSANGGRTWSGPTTVAGPTKVTQLAKTSLGNMVGDYIATAVLHGKAFSLFAVGKAPAQGRAFNEAMYTAGGLPVTGGTARSTTGPVRASLSHRADVHLPSR